MTALIIFKEFSLFCKLCFVLSAVDISKDKYKSGHSLAQKTSSSLSYKSLSKLKLILAVVYSAQTFD